MGANKSTDNPRAVNLAGGSEKTYTGADTPETLREWKTVGTHELYETATGLLRDMEGGVPDVVELWNAATDFLITAGHFEAVGEKHNAANAEAVGQLVAEL